MARNYADDANVVDLSGDNGLATFHYHLHTLPSFYYNIKMAPNLPGYIIRVQQTISEHIRINALISPPVFIPTGIKKIC